MCVKQTSALFLLPFYPIESSSSAPLHFHSYPQDWGGLLFFQVYLLTFMSPLWMASPPPAWGPLFSADPDALGSHKSLSTFAVSIDGKSCWRERKPSSNNWSQRPRHHCGYQPLLRAGFCCLPLLSHGLKLIAQRAAVIVGVDNILHRSISANGALSSG